MCLTNVVVAEIDQPKREALEQRLQQNEHDFAVMVDISSSQSERASERRLKSRGKITLIENSLARVHRLKPKILLVGAQYFLDTDCAFFARLRSECPETLVILLTDETTEDRQIMKALEKGVRGFLNGGADLIHFSKAIKAVMQGEAWVPREMLGQIMEKILATSHENSVEVRLDSSS